MGIDPLPRCPKFTSPPSSSCSPPDSWIGYWDLWVGSRAGTTTIKGIIIMYMYYKIIHRVDLPSNRFKTVKNL